MILMNIVVALVAVVGRSPKTRTKLKTTKSRVKWNERATEKKNKNRKPEQQTEDDPESERENLRLRNYTNRPGPAWHGTIVLFFYIGALGRLIRKWNDTWVKKRKNYLVFMMLVPSCCYLQLKIIINIACLWMCRSQVVVVVVRRISPRVRSVLYRRSWLCNSSWSLTIGGWSPSTDWLPKPLPHRWRWWWS